MHRLLGMALPGKALLAKGDWRDFAWKGAEREGGEWGGGAEQHPVRAMDGMYAHMCFMSLMVCAATLEKSWA